MSPPMPACFSELGSDAASLISEKLLLLPSALEPCPFPFRWLNLTPRRGLVISTFVCAARRNCLLERKMTWLMTETSKILVV
jgi:hypothetical protein